MRGAELQLHAPARWCAGEAEQNVLAVVGMAAVERGQVFEELVRPIVGSAVEVAERGRGIVFCRSSEEEVGGGRGKGSNGEP